MRLVPLLAFLWTGPARAAAHLLLSAEGDAAILVDGQGVGDLTGGAELPLALDEPGGHTIEVRTVAGKRLHMGTLQAEDEQVLRVHWTGTALVVEKAEVADEPGDRTERTAAERAQAALQTAQAGAAVASVVMPSSGLIGAAQSAATLTGAGSSLVRSAQDAASRAASAPPPRRSVHEEHDLTALAQRGGDPYAASGGRPAFDASLCAVTLLAGGGLAATVSVDGQAVATLGPEAPSATVLLVPGLRTVQILDAASGALLWRGRLTAGAGQVFDLSFSAVEAPVASQPDVWR